MMVSQAAVRGARCGHHLLVTGLTPSRCLRAQGHATGNGELILRGRLSRERGGNERGMQSSSSLINLSCLPAALHSSPLCAMVRGARSGLPQPLSAALQSGACAFVCSAVMVGWESITGGQARDTTCAATAL